MVGGEQSVELPDPPGDEWTPDTLLTAAAFIETTLMPEIPVIVKLLLASLWADFATA